MPFDDVLPHAPNRVRSFGGLTDTPLANSEVLGYAYLSCVNLKGRSSFILGHFPATKSLSVFWCSKLFIVVQPGLRAEDFLCQLCILSAQNFGAFSKVPHTGWMCHTLDNYETQLPRMDCDHLHLNSHWVKQNETNANHVLEH